MVVEKLSCNPALVEFNKNYDELKRNYLEARERNGTGITGVSDALERVLFEQMYVNFITSAKLKYIYQGANSCFREENYIGLAYFARAALEHIGTYAYLVQETDNAVMGLRNQSSEEKIHSLLKKLSNTYAVSYYGSSDPNVKPSQKLKPINVYSGLNALSCYFEGDTDDYSALFHQKITREEIIFSYGIDYEPVSTKNPVHTDYDFLCNFVHPNFGSNYLISSGKINEGHIDLKDNSHSYNLAVLFLKKCLRYWVYYDQKLWNKSAVAHMHLSAWHARSFVKGAKLQRLFTEKSFKCVGSGESIESAITFPMARDMIEEMQMYYEMLEKEDLMEMSQDILSVGEGYVVKRITMQNGKQLFVKFVRNLT